MAKKLEYRAVFRKTNRAKKSQSKNVTSKKAAMELVKGCVVGKVYSREAGSDATWNLIHENQG